MGLLDDAIREHLELKRRHGADPDEVTRQEREALGAPARGEFAKPAGEAEVAEEPDVDEAADARDEGSADLDVPEADFEDEREPGPPGGPEPEDVAEEPEPGTEEDPWLVEDLADEEESAEPEKPVQGEDVLEETPEFLQETPEHDRLWFEQKPPRDFDWDK